MNQVLRFYPVGSRKELCNSVVCHRSELAFGRYVDQCTRFSCTNCNDLILFAGFGLIVTSIRKHTLSSLIFLEGCLCAASRILFAWEPAALSSHRPHPPPRTAAHLPES
jgi:hypothetical protein